MGKRTRLRKFFQKLAVVLAVILAVPSTPMPNLNGSNFTEVHAEGVNELERIEFESTTVNDGSALFSVRYVVPATDPVPTGTVKLDYTTDFVETAPIDGIVYPLDGATWTNVKDDLEFGQTYSFTIPDALKGKTIAVRAVYSGDSNYKSKTIYEKADFEAPQIKTISTLTKSSATETAGYYSFTLDLEKAYKDIGTADFDEAGFYYIISEYSADGYDNIRPIDIVNTGSNTNDAVNTDAYQNFFLSVGDHTEITLLVDGKTLTEGIYVLQIAGKDISGNIGNKIVSAPFSTFDTLTLSSSDLGITIPEDGLEYDGSDLSSEVDISVTSTDATRKAKVEEWLNYAKACGGITTYFLQKKDGDGKEVTGAVSGSALTLAGTYDVYLSTVDSNVTIQAAPFREINVSKLEIVGPGGKLDLNYELQVSSVSGGTINQYKVIADVSGITNSNNDDYLLEYSFDGVNYSAVNYVVADPGAIVRCYVRFSATVNTKESAPLTIYIKLPSAGTIYTASELQASLSGELTYTGETQTPVINVSAKSGLELTKAESVNTWIKGALAKNTLSFKYRKIKDGNEAAVAGAELSASVCDAGTYEIYAESSDPTVAIMKESIGTFTVSKGVSEKPDAKPVLSATVSENKEYYIVSADVSKIKNGKGKTLEFKFNSGEFTTENAVTAGALKEITASVRFAADANREASDAVALAGFKADDASAKPGISIGTYNGGYVIIITPGSTDNKVSSKTEIYYTTDGTTPTISSFSNIGRTSINVLGSTTIRAFAVEPGKIRSEEATFGYTAQANGGSGQNQNTNGNQNNVSIVPVTGILLNKSSYTLEKDSQNKNSVIIKASVSPSNATNKSVSWTVDKEGIVSLSATNSRGGEEITVTAKKEGTVTITATSNDNPKCSANFVVTVIPHSVHQWKFNGFTWKKKQTVATGTFTCAIDKQKNAANVKMSVEVRGEDKYAISAITAKVTKDPDKNKLEKAITETKYVRADGTAATKEEFESLLSDTADANAEWNLFYTDQDTKYVHIGETRLTDNNGNFVYKSKKFTKYYDLEILEDASSGDVKKYILKISLKKNLSVTRRKNATKKANGKIRVAIFDDSGAQSGTFEYQLRTCYKVPQLKLTNNKGTILLDYKDEKGNLVKQPQFTIVTIRESSNTAYEPLDISTLKDVDKVYYKNKNKKELLDVKTELGSKTGELVLTYEGSIKVSGVLCIQLENWADLIALNYSITTNNKRQIYISKNGQTPLAGNVIARMNRNVPKGQGEPIVFDISISGSTDPELLKGITVNYKFKNGADPGFIVEGIDENGKLLDSSIRIKYPDDPTKLQQGKHKLIFQDANSKIKNTITIDVNQKNISVLLRIKAVNKKIDPVVGKKAVFSINTSSWIEGSISSVSIDDEDVYFDVDYNAENNEIYLDVKEGIDVPANSYNRTFTIIYGGVEIRTKIKGISVSPSKPKVTINQVVFDRNDVVAGTAESKTYVMSEVGELTVKPSSVVFVGATANTDLGSGWYTYSWKKGSTVFLRYDETDNNIYVVPMKETTPKKITRSIKVQIYYDGRITRKGKANPVTKKLKVKFTGKLKSTKPVQNNNTEQENVTQ